MIPQYHARRQRAAHLRKKQPDIHTATPWNPPISATTTLTMNRDGSDWFYIGETGLSSAVIGGYSGLPVTPNGGDITVKMTDGGIYII